MNRSLVILIAALMVASTTAYAERKKKSSDERAPYTVVPLQSASTLDSTACIYALPRTVLRVTMKVECAEFTPGIYARYAQKYLGISNVQTKAGTEFRMASARLSAYTEPDPQQYYVLYTNGPTPNFLALTQDGLLLLPESAASGGASEIAGALSRKHTKLFTDVAVDGMFREVRTRRVVPDEGEDTLSARKPVPVLLQAKTPEDCAAEAAQQIFNLRRRRIELITGEVDNVFSGNGHGLQIALKEIQRLERSYLNLFVGSTQHSTAKYVYEVRPNEKDNSYPICSFSPAEGIADDGAANVYLTISDEAAIIDSIPPFISSINQLRLRFPRKCSLRLTFDGAEWQRGHFRVYQRGLSFFYSLNQ